MNRTRQYTVQREQHKGDFSNFIYNLCLGVVDDLKDEGSEWLKATVEYNGSNDFLNGCIILGNQIHLILIMFNLPPVLVKSQRIIDMELRWNSILLPIDYLHQYLCLINSIHPELLGCSYGCSQSLSSIGNALRSLSQHPSPISKIYRTPTSTEIHSSNNPYSSLIHSQPNHMNPNRYFSYKIYKSQPSPLSLSHSS
jgi:hypothetical protein